MIPQDDSQQAYGEIQSSRRAAPKVITKTPEAMLKALDDLRRNQLNTIPDAIEMFYSGKNEALRTGNRRKTMLVSMHLAHLAREVETSKIQNSAILLSMLWQQGHTEDA